MIESCDETALFIYEELPFLIPVFVGIAIYSIYLFFKPFLRKEKEDE